MTENKEIDKWDGAGNTSTMHTSLQEQQQQQQNFVNKQIQ